MSDCLACKRENRGESRGVFPHDCEDFPLPPWSREYLALFDAMLGMPTVTREGIGGYLAAKRSERLTFRERFGVGVAA